MSTTTTESIAAEPQEIRTRIEQKLGVKLSAETLAPVDQRIENYLKGLFSDLTPAATALLPRSTFVLDSPGMASSLSLPAIGDRFESEIISSYRVKQGVLHNPKNDRRTTQGAFHICEGGHPIPDDKISVTKEVFRELLCRALIPPEALLKIPFTINEPSVIKGFVSLLIRPVVCPEVPNHSSQKSMEIRFFAPGSLVSNLDFIERIFGNAGDPFLLENDAALDVEGWTGHTGCVILAPHLTSLKKKDLGLPPIEKASARQKRDGMCWQSPDELYNEGQAFKITSRDPSGVIVTLIADNYFGYCKKEVKTQIGFSANLYGLCEEEHSGGALAFASYDLGEEFSLDKFLTQNENRMPDVLRYLGDSVIPCSEGHAIDRRYPNIIYVPQDAHFNLLDQTVQWQHQGVQSIRLRVDHTYVLPSGYKVFMKKQTGGHAWHLIGTLGEGTLCHKPCTVSGGGKSEISKPIVDAMIQGPIFTADFHKDMQSVSELLSRDYGNRFIHKKPSAGRISRPVLSPERSLGSVIKLFTVADDYTDEYNRWLRSIPDYIKEILFTIKRFYRAEWDKDISKHFSADIVNGHIGHELKFNNRKLIANYLRVGRELDGAWRIFRVRADFAAAEKIQFADDITASIVVPNSWLGPLNPLYRNESVKLIHNCEQTLFQRPDDAIYRGYDKQTELDLSRPSNFLSNFEPLDLNAAREIAEETVSFDLFTDPMKQLLSDFVRDGQPGFVVSSAHLRIVDGKPSKNPRYLQQRPDKANLRRSYLAEIGTRLRRNVSFEEKVNFPVNAVLTGRRNNPPDRKNHVPSLAVYNPIHYQQAPELFIDFICSLTGKSPSTTGFGTEGALTKGPFNALPPVIDLNNALVSFILTRSHGFSSAAGYVGPRYKVDHDISLLMPEIWCRMRPYEQDPDYLIQNGFLEKILDFDHKGRKIQASLLGYRVNHRFVNEFLGRIFSNPEIVFNEEMLAPEKQSVELFAEGIDNIVLTIQRVSKHYFLDGSIKAACPPLKALLHIMHQGHYEGQTIDSATLRSQFERNNVLASDWYHKRLRCKQTCDSARWKKFISTLESFLSMKAHQSVAMKLDLAKRLEQAKSESVRAGSPAYLDSLVGTIGADPLAVGL